jgi:gliding motility-associated lipoprotein GldD
MQNKSVYLFVFLISLLFACNQKDVLPKPEAQLALKYEKPTYTLLDIADCPYQFKINTATRLKTPKTPKPCWTNIYYPKQKATIFITYNALNDTNLKDYLRDAQKLPLQHTSQAEQIEASIYKNEKNKTYGNFYEVEGDAASQAQFYVTDSIHHFFSGSIYFDAVPNYDSILPAAAYLKKDMRHIMESLTWK